MSGAAWPQQIASDEAIEEIQVTATRRPQLASEVSASLTIVTGEDIAGGSLLTDALALRPGVYLQQTTPGQGAAIVRGLKGSEVLHLVDGMRLNNAIFRNAPTQYFALVAPGTVERIEVVRGAPASLYGSDAVGGVVQAISRIPRFEERGSRRDAYIAFDTADLTQIVRGSVEFGDEKTAALVSGEYLRSGNRRTGDGLRIGPSGYDSKGGRVALSLTPNDDTSWLFDLQFARQPMTPRTDELIPGFGQTAPSSSEFWFTPNDRLFAHGRYSRDNGYLGATWNVDLGWQRIVDDRISRNFQSAIRRFEANSSDLFGLTINASGTLQNGSWIVGADIYRDRVESERTELNLNSGQLETVRPRFPDGSTSSQAAVYGNVLRSVGERSNFSAGIRFSAIDTDLAPTAASPSASSGQDDFSADFGWVFDLSDNMQLTTNVGYGFRAPNIFDLGTLGERPGNRFNLPSADLESERVTQFDIGVRRDSERISLDLVLFALRYTDRIASVLTGDTTATGRDIVQSQNIGRADIVGLEFSTRWLPTPNLQADLVVNYLRGEQSGVNGFNVPGDRIPPLNGRLQFRYAWNDFIRVEPYLSFAAKQDRLSPRDANDIRINPLGTAGWVTMNIATSWQVSETFRLQARFENLLDRAFRSHGSGIDSAGRNFLLGASVNW